MAVVGTGNPAGYVGQEGEHNNAPPSSTIIWQALKKGVEESQKGCLDTPQSGPEESNDGELVLHESGSTNEELHLSLGCHADHVIGVPLCSFRVDDQVDDVGHL